MSFIGQGHSMSARAFHVVSSSGHEIPCYEWRGNRREQPSVVLIVHGLGDHGRALPYGYLAEALTSDGHATYSYDHRGHGTVARRERGRARLSTLTDDLVSVAQWLRQEHPSRPLVVIGLSMGAVVATLACQRQPDVCDGLILAAAPLGPVSAGAVTVAAATWLGRFLPRLGTPTGIDVGSVTDNAAALASYTGDPLFHSNIGLGLAADLLAVMPGLLTSVTSLRTSTLVLHGDLDTVAPWPATVFSVLQSSRVQVQTFARGHHNLFLDSERRQVFETVLTWVHRQAMSGRVAPR